MAMVGEQEGQLAFLADANSVARFKVGPGGGLHFSQIVIILTELFYNTSHNQTFNTKWQVTGITQ